LPVRPARARTTLREPRRAEAPIARMARRGTSGP